MAGFRFGLRHLASQELVIRALYRIHLDALTDKTATRTLRLIGRLYRLLAGIAGCGSVGDIVSSYEQTLLSSLECAQANTENTVTHRYICS